GGRSHERHQGCDDECLEPPALSHFELPLYLILHRTKRWLAIPAGMRRDRRLSHPSTYALFISNCSRAAQQGRHQCADEETVHRIIGSHPVIRLKRQLLAHWQHSGGLIE